MKRSKIPLTVQIIRYGHETTVRATDLPAIARDILAGEGRTLTANGGTIILRREKRDGRTRYVATLAPECRWDSATSRHPVALYRPDWWPVPGMGMDIDLNSGEVRVPKNPVSAFSKKTPAATMGRRAILAGRYG